MAEDRLLIHRSDDDEYVMREPERALPTDPIVFGPRWLAALRQIVRHADFPAGESWEQAYIEVTTMAREALGDA
jgi:hypothetical protein